MLDEPLPCPRCGAPLFEGQARAARLLGCGECGGVWLDSVASKAVLTGDAQDLVSLAERASQHARVGIDAQASGLLCPECRQVLTRGIAPGTRVELDLCPSHGTWFDANELRVVALAYARLPAAAEFSEAYPEERARRPPAGTPLGTWVWNPPPGRWQDDRPPRDNEIGFEQVMDFLVGLIDRNGSGGGPPRS